MKTNKFKTTVISALGLVIFSCSLSANESSELLKKTIIDAQSRFSNSQLQPVSTHLGGLDAWVDKSEVKWANRDLSNFADQKISYELQFKNHQQVTVEQELLNMEQKRRALKISNYLAQQLDYRYNTLIDAIQQQKQQRLLQQQHTLAQGELNSWKFKVNSDDFRADKLQQADLALDDIWGEMLENGASYEHLRQQGLSQKILSQDTQSRPTIRQIVRTVDKIIKSGEYQHHNYRIQTAEMGIQTAIKKQQRAIAQQKLSLKSFKLEYGNKDEDFGVSIGIKVPLTKNSFESLETKQALHFRYLDAQNTRLDIASQLTEKRNQLIQLSNLWESNQRLLKKVDSRMSRLAATQNIDLQSALTTQKIKLEKRNNRIEIKALREYISFLKIAGMLASKPYKNWLQAGTPALF